MSSNSTSKVDQQQVSVEDVDADFLPLIYDLLRNVERDVQDNNQKLRDCQDSNKKMQDLKSKLNNCREQIRKLAGLDYNEIDQIKNLDSLRQQLISKQELLLKYHDMCHFDVNKI